MSTWSDLASISDGSDMDTRAVNYTFDDENPADSTADKPKTSGK